MKGEVDQTYRNRLAVLIDAENVPIRILKDNGRGCKYGTLTIKRIYADWTNSTLAGWKNSH